MSTGRLIGILLVVGLLLMILKVDVNMAVANGFKFLEAVTNR